MITAAFVTFCPFDILSSVTLLTDIKTVFFIHFGMSFMKTVDCSAAFLGQKKFRMGNMTISLHQKPC